MLRSLRGGADCAEESSLNVKERRQVAVAKVASNANNGDGASDSNRSFIERDMNKSARCCKTKSQCDLVLSGAGRWLKRWREAFSTLKSCIVNQSRAMEERIKQATVERLCSRKVGHREYSLKRAAVLDESDIIFLCVKPNKMLSILDEIKPRVKPWHVFVSVAAGIKTSDIEKHLDIGTNAETERKRKSGRRRDDNTEPRGLFNLGGRKKNRDGASNKPYDGGDAVSVDDDDDDDEYQSDKIIAAAQLEGEEIFYDDEGPGYNESRDNNYNSDKKDTNTDLLPTPSVVRVMPNTPCFVREGAIACSGGKTASLATVKMVSSLFSNLGLFVIIEESQMHAIVGVPVRDQRTYLHLSRLWQTQAS